jgi:myo-inositol-1(or 4)-monophosphatase
LIVLEAGGRISDFGGGEFSPFGKETLATNGHIHVQMIEVLKRENDRERETDTGDRI